MKGANSSRKMTLAKENQSTSLEEAADGPTGPHASDLAHTMLSLCVQVPCQANPPLVTEVASSQGTGLPVARRTAYHAHSAEVNREVD